MRLIGLCAPNHNRFIHQTRYTQDILVRFSMQDSHAVTPPAEANKSLSACNDPADELIQKDYSQAIGCLKYLIVCNQPDLAYVVSKVAQFQAHPRKSHWQAVKCNFLILARHNFFGYSLFRHQSIDVYIFRCWSRMRYWWSQIAHWLLFPLRGRYNFLDKPQTRLCSWFYHGLIIHRDGRNIWRGHLPIYPVSFLISIVIWFFM